MFAVHRLRKEGQRSQLIGLPAWHQTFLRKPEPSPPSRGGWPLQSAVGDIIGLCGDALRICRHGSMNFQLITLPLIHPFVQRLLLSDED